MSSEWKLEKTLEACRTQVAVTIHILRKQPLAPLPKHRRYEKRIGGEESKLHMLLLSSVDGDMQPASGVGPLWPGNQTALTRVVRDWLSSKAFIRKMVVKTKSCVCRE
jgi:hypothetical protein